jgi:glucokinase
MHTLSDNLQASSLNANYGDRERNSIDSLIKKTLPAIGIDLGGTKIRAALVQDNRLASQPRQVPTPQGPDKIIEAILDLVASFQQEYTVTGVGIATAGIVNCDSGDIIGSTGNLPGWTGTPLKQVLESRTLLPTLVDNDANAATYGEASSNHLLHAKCVSVVTLGTGIGGGLIINGKMFRGAHWGAAEIGHMRINMGNQRLCTCGLFDCWEAYGAGIGLVNTGKDVLRGLTEYQTPLLAKLDTLTTHDIANAAKVGDMAAQKALHKWHEYIAAGMINIAHILDPDAFIVTGGLADLVDFTLLQEMIVDRCLPTIGEKLIVRKSELGGMAGIVGAGQLVLDTILEGKGHKRSL